MCQAGRSDEVSWCRAAGAGCIVGVSCRRQLVVAVEMVAGDTTAACPCCQYILHEFPSPPPLAFGSFACQSCALCPYLCHVLVKHGGVQEVDARLVCGLPHIVDVTTTNDAFIGVWQIPAVVEVLLQALQHFLRANL